MCRAIVCELRVIHNRALKMRDPQHAQRTNNRNLNVHDSFQRDARLKLANSVNHIFDMLFTLFTKSLTRIR